MILIDKDKLGLSDMEIIMCNGDYKEELKMLIDKIERAPTIEERKKGAWIREPYSATMNQFRCANCMNVSMLSSALECRFKYCPHCGADMRGNNNAAIR